MSNIFVSYSHKDRIFARQFVDDLHPKASSVWFDEDNIIPGQNWDDEIENGINQADIFLSLLSPNTLSSPNCKDEYDNALRLDKTVIPILIQDFDTNKLLWMRIGRKQWVDLTSNYHHGFQQLLKAVEYYTKTPVSTSRNCLICGATTNLDTCNTCGAVHCPTQLGQLYGLSPTALQAYIKHYQPRSAVPNASVNELLATALIYLAMRSFDTAKSFLERIIQLHPTHAYAWYALALAELGGRRPRLLNRNEAVEIQSHALKATEYDPTQSHAFLFLALLKSDYFENKGFRVDKPFIAQCIDMANKGTIRRSELQTLIHLIPDFDNKIIRSINDVLI